MVSRQNICYLVLKHHGFLVSYSGNSLDSVTTKPKNKETFGQWKNRVLGSEAKDIVVYMPVEPSPRTLITTIQKKSGGEHIKKIFEAFEQFKDRKKDEAVSATKEETYELFSTIPKDTLREVVSSFDGELEPSLVEFFKRLLQAKNKDIDTAELPKSLLKGYNGAVRNYRELGANRVEG